MSKGLPKRSEDYSLWYNELVKKSRFSRKFACARVHGDQAIRVFYLGKDAGTIG